jgi:Fic family protein
MLDATQNYDRSLIKSRLFDWHASGAYAQEKIHYVAPRAAHLDTEMTTILGWSENSADMDLLLKTSIAHLWLVTIYPFDNGNGRIVRANADLMLARSEVSAQRFYSMSAQIQVERNAYYEILDTTQKGGRDITPWLDWFLGCLDRAFNHAEDTLSKVFEKARFWKRYADASFNDRQKDMLLRLLDGFIGKLTTARRAKIEKCSPDTALQYITDLIELRILVKKPGGGRNTSYALVSDKSEAQ